MIKDCRLCAHARAYTAPVNAHLVWCRFYAANRNVGVNLCEAFEANGEAGPAIESPLEGFPIIGHGGDPPDLDEWQSFDVIPKWWRFGSFDKPLNKVTFARSVARCVELAWLASAERKVPIRSITVVRHGLRLVVRQDAPPDMVEALVKALDGAPLAVNPRPHAWCQDEARPGLEVCQHCGAERAQGADECNPGREGEDDSEAAIQSDVRGNGGGVARGARDDGTTGAGGGA